MRVSGPARPVSGLLGVALVAVLIAGCAASAPNGVTVNGRALSQSSVNRELAAIGANSVLKKDVTTKKGALKPAITASWLSAVVEAQVAADQVRRGHLTITKADRAAAVQWAQQFFGSQSAFSAFPKWFQTTALSRYANVPAFVRSKVKTPTDADLRADYETSLTQSCPSDRYVSHILVTTQAAAEQLESQLAAGASFAQLAAQNSTDTQSAKSGGGLGCIDNQQIDATFAAAAKALAVGQVSSPVQTQYGWHVIKVDDARTAVPFDSVKSEIRADMVERSPKGQADLAKLMTQAKVKLARRYGRWVRTKQSAQVEVPKPAKSGSTTSTSFPASSTTTSTAP